MRLILGLILAGVLTAACGTAAGEPPGGTPIPREAVPTVNPENTEMAAAQQNYNIYCAHCHGYMGDGQGAGSEDRTRSLGYHIVPRHDQYGETWRHPDQLLFETVKYGIPSPLNLYVMAEYGSRLSDDEIMGVIQYLKRFWTDDQRTHQAALTAQFAEDYPDWEQDHFDAADAESSQDG